ncbi:hypothetical protein BSL78_01403 [Apostichopus japonicus]|uniref:Uncharacterized protein n=1 Tax=Stichopus japonicus TaxID=307972 RepID=A0A2G8LN67_STIJA|nr:hypothetical protein BSL78_01403 [Apostichopus japonicus]
MWEQTLVDLLLNFAGTPKGLLLLQQTGAMNEAVAYMNGRYTQKLQVSKTEKFGYGFMVTQVASTSPGVMALENTGFIQALLHELWSVLECGRDDQPCFGSNSHQAHSIDDRPAQKRCQVTFPFQPEQTQVFGLRLLNVMSTCLDSWLLLETQYKLWDFLLDEQNSNRNDENGEIMIDHMSLERNHILVRTNVIGGPTERTLPARSLSEDSGKVYPWRMFSSFPVPKEYFTTVNRSSSGKTDSAFGEFLEKPSDGMNPTEWLKLCQDTFCHELKSNPEGVQGKELLEKVLAVQQQIPDEYQTFPLKPCKVTDATLKGRKLSNMQTLGSKWPFGKIVQSHIQ